MFEIKEGLYAHLRILVNSGRSACSLSPVFRIYRNTTVILTQESQLSFPMKTGYSYKRKQIILT